MAVMGRLQLLVLVYVALDFGNPLMPGAVRFEGGSLESVQADRAGREAVAAAPPPATLETADRLPPDPEIRPRIAAPVRPRRERRDVRRPPSSHASSSPSPAEDH
jgi:hypothetical protein